MTTYRIQMEMKPTRVHKVRWFIYTPVNEHSGTVEIHEGKDNTAPITGRYLVSERTKDTYCRCFAVLSSLNQGASQYWVGIETDPNLDSCDCKGFESHGHCKHRDAIRALIQTGIFS